MSHKKCSTKIVHDTMKEFENKKLKLRNNTVVKDRKQAIAIALSQAENKCTYSSKEYKILEIKVKEFLSFEIKDKIPLTRVIETRELIEYYNKKKNIKKCHKYERALWYLILTSIKHGVKVSRNIWDELNTIKNIL